MFYENIDVLKKLISEVSHYYKNKAIGMKLYTEVMVVTPKELNVYNINLDTVEFQVEKFY
jgi:hypothetical protein